jgi:hypothetical protein
MLVIKSAVAMKLKAISVQHCGKHKLVNRKSNCLRIYEGCQMHCLMSCVYVRCNLFVLIRGRVGPKKYE